MQITMISAKGCHYSKVCDGFVVLRRTLCRSHDRKVAKTDAKSDFFPPFSTSKDFSHLNYPEVKIGPSLASGKSSGKSWADRKTSQISNGSTALITPDTRVLVSFWRNQFLTCTFLPPFKMDEIGRKDVTGTCPGNSRNETTFDSSQFPPFPGLGRILENLSPFVNTLITPNGNDTSPHFVGAADDSHGHASLRRN